MKNDIDQGRALQFDEMMKALSELQAKYKGVRGELLAKVRDELAKTKPSATPTTDDVKPAKATPARPSKAQAPKASPPPAPVEDKPKSAPPALAKSAANKATDAMLPSCRLCGRGMRRADDGSLVCAVGHVRAAA
jgi:pyruvate/2-oxoglutarate dehydrogenase complex dihydrolipoamide acyltransferase (E2) component